uniref:ANK_REP_REGION domain-containing protein n=1 Tax=Toxocara canis TaxID=6265 RepID=A0A183V356_TOXCA
LEDILLSGRAHLLVHKSSNNIKTKAFLNVLDTYKEKIERFLEAICTGDTKTVEELISYRRIIDAKHPSTMASTIHLATIHEQAEILKLLLKQRNAPIDHRDLDGRTALHYAAAIAGIPGADQECYDLLIEAGAKEHITDSEGYTPDHYKRNPELMDMLQVKGSNKYPRRLVDEIDKLIEERNLPELQRIVLSGDYWRLENRIFPQSSRDLERTLSNLLTRMMGIHQAIRDDDLTALKQLVDDERLASACDDLGRTPLHIAVLLNRKDICEYLLMVFPRIVDRPDKEGRTALHYASVIPDSDVRKSLTTLLINAGANKHLTDSKGHSPSSYSRDNRQAQSLYRAVRTKTLDMIDEDEENIDTDVEERILNLNFESTSFNELENIQIEGKSDQIWRNRLNSAIIAVEENDIRKLKNLVNTELILSRDSRGLSLLHIAVCKERHEIVEYLATEFPNSVDITDEVGRSPVHYAATQQNAIYDTLVEFGADPTRPDNDGWTAARYRSYPDRFVRPVSQLTHISPPIISRLSLDENIFDPGAPSEEDVERWLAEGDVQKLEQVMLDGRVHLLIDKKTVNLASDEFLRGVPQYQAKIDAIHKAVEDGDVRRVKSLIDRPQLATARDRYGMTPLHKALLHGQTNTVRYLLAKYPSCVNAADHAGRTALHYAAADSNGEHMIKVLQKAGGDAFIEDKTKQKRIFFKIGPPTVYLYGLDGVFRRQSDCWQIARAFRAMFLCY